MPWGDLSLVVFLVAGSCTFDEGFSQCDYQQDLYDDFDWTHINTQEVPYVSPDLPQGETSSLLSLSSASQSGGSQKLVFQMKLLFIKWNTLKCGSRHVWFIWPDHGIKNRLTANLSIRPLPLWTVFFKSIQPPFFRQKHSSSFILVE